MSRLVARAESWERVYTAFQNINFAAFDFNTIKQSILDYIKLYFPETFNDFIESSEFIAIVEVFAYIAELLAYRIDVNAHENFITTAQRKDSILRLAKFISYTPARPLPARGLVKITSVSTTESVVDANGIDLANRTIRWNDTSNSSWKDQFIMVMNRILEQEFGTVSPTDRFQIQDVLFEMYSVGMVPLPTGVFSYNANVNGQTLPMELVPVTYNSSEGIVERRPNNNSNFTLMYGQDGLGDASDTTGFFCYTKQGSLQRFRTTFDGITPNITYEVAAQDVNDTDVWVNNVDPITGAIVDIESTLPYRAETLSGKSGEWVEVDLAHAQNVIFNTNPKRNKYELETLDDNGVRIMFGDGEFADIPQGTFDIWVRTSVDQDVVIPQSAVTNTKSSFTYIDIFGRTQTFTFEFSLINSLQNASAAEDIEHVRANAPAVYYSQDRMVNGEDYNVFMLQDPSILKLRAINRTFAGDSRYMTWHDATGTYEDVKLFGDDGNLYFEDINDSERTPIVDVNALITSYIEPLLSSTDIFVQIIAANVPISKYRRIFTTPEKDRLVAALTPPPTPASVKMYYNKVLCEWYAIKSSDPSIEDTFSDDVLGAGNGWPGAFITEPLITIDQVNIFETRYDVTRTAKRLMFSSPTTTFWNTNSSSRVISYDTLNSDYDEITILQANINSNRTGVLSQHWKYYVVGQSTIESGPEIGLTDENRLSIMPVDEDNSGYPPGLNVDNEQTFVGLANIIKPKYTIDVSTLPTPLPASGYAITLPIYYWVGAGDVALYDEDGYLLPSANWVEDETATVSNKIYLLNRGSNNSLRVTVNEYVYQQRTSADDEWVDKPATADNIYTFVQDAMAATDLWRRFVGRSGLNFSWMHRSPRYHLVDPAPSNIIDMVIIPKGYYISVKRWLEDPTLPKPMEPTPLDLRTSYNYLLDNKMISDTIVLHPGRIKLLFGPRAIPQLQAVFKVIKSQNSTLTDNQIKTSIVASVRNFFDVTTWEFGETFYFSELAAAIHKALPNDISSVVLVPVMKTNMFGSLYQILAREDEVFMADIGAEQIDIVPSLNVTNLNMAQTVNQTIITVVNTTSSGVASPIVDQSDCYVSNGYVASTYTSTCNINGG